jgi:hypothetical protein
LAGGNEGVNAISLSGNWWINLGAVPDYVLHAMAAPMDGGNPKEDWLLDAINEEKERRANIP